MKTLKPVEPEGLAVPAQVDLDPRTLMAFELHRIHYARAIRTIHRKYNSVRKAFVRREAGGSLLRVKKLARITLIADLIATHNLAAQTPSGPARITTVEGITEYRLGTAYRCDPEMD